MIEIVESNSSSDVSSNSSWTILDDAEKNNTEKVVPETTKQIVESTEAPCNGFSTGIPMNASENDNKHDVKEKLIFNNQKTAAFNIYHALQNKTFIGTLTIIGTVLALTGLSFLCLLFPPTDSAFVAKSMARADFSNLTNNSLNYTCPVYELENGSLLIDDPSGRLAKNLKEMAMPQNAQGTSDFANDQKKNSSEELSSDLLPVDIKQYPQSLEETLPVDIKMYPQTLEDFIKTRNNNEIAKENNEAEVANKNLPQEENVSEDNSDKGNRIKDKVVLILKNV